MIQVLSCCLCCCSYIVLWVITTKDRNENLSISPFSSFTHLSCSNFCPVKCSFFALLLFARGGAVQYLDSWKASRDNLDHYVARINNAELPLCRTSLKKQVRKPTDQCKLRSAIKVRGYLFNFSEVRDKYYALTALNPTIVLKEMTFWSAGLVSFKELLLAHSYL